MKARCARNLLTENKSVAEKRSPVKFLCPALILSTGENKFWNKEGLTVS